MDTYETQNMLLPHNLPYGDGYIKKVKKLINTAEELGGTVYEVAADSGLLSARHFMELQFDEQVTSEHMLSEDMTVVTEVYVQFAESPELDRIFLYSDDARNDIALKEEGNICDGKLVIAYDKLKSLHAKGYKCLCQRSEDGHNGKSFVRYHSSFGNDRKMQSFQPWDSSVTFVGNGFNQALLVNTVFETVFVMPDIYAVEESIKTFYAEELIREKYDVGFWIERISQQDEKVMATLQDRETDILGSSRPEIYGGLPESYKRLIYQIAYIKTYYPDVYELVWDEHFEPDDERTAISFDTSCASVGISLGCYETYAVCRMADGSIKRVPNMKYSYDTPLCQKYRFKGYGDIRNAGAAGSRMGLIMKEIKESAEFLFDVCVEKVYVTHIGDLPDREEIVRVMKRRLNRAEMRGNANRKSDLIAYEEIADKNMDGLEVIKWAAELANLPGFEYVDSLNAMVNAFEKSDERNVLKGDEIALLYDFRECDLILSLIRRNADNELEIIAQEEEFEPELGIYDAEDYDYDEGEYNPSLELVLGRDMDQFMTAAGLGALGICGENEVDEEAFEELRRSAPRVKRQFRRNDEVKLIFNNGYLSMMETYPVAGFQKCFEPVLKKSDALLRSVLDGAGLCMEDISKVFLAGEETEYPFVRKRIEELTKKEVCCINASVCIAARGAVLS